MVFKMKKLIALMTLSLLFGQLSAQRIEDGYKALDMEDYNLAKKIFSKLLVSNPSDANILMQLGNACAMTSSKDSMLNYYNLAARDANSPLYKIAVGKVEYFSGKKPDAKATFEAALKKSKAKDITLPLEIAYAYMSPISPDYYEAAYYLNKAKEIDYKNQRVLINLGNAYSLSKEDGKAMTAYEQAASYGDNSVVSYKMGVTNMYAKNYTTAIENFEKAVKIDPNYAEAYEKLGEVYYLNKQYNKAGPMFKKYVELRADDEKASERYANFLYLKDDFVNLKKELPAYLSLQPDNIQFNRLLGYAEFETKSYDSSLLYLNKYFDLARKKDFKPVAMDYMYLGNTYSEMKLDSQAIIAYKSALELDPKKTEVNEKLADASFKTKKWNDAIYYLNLINANAEKPSANNLFKLGRCYYVISDYTNAETTFKRLSEIIPEQTYGWLWLGKTQAKMDNKDKPAGIAEAAYQTFITVAQADLEKNKKDLIDAYNYIGLVKYNRNDKSAAATMYQNILNLDPSNANAKNNLAACKQ